MAQQQLVAIENNFTKGLITEATGLNFPENAATECDNTAFSLTGAVDRRLGIDCETNFASISTASTDSITFNSFVWTNAGGDGNSQIVVQQVGGTLYFFLASVATATLPLSRRLIASTVTFIPFIVTGSSFDVSAECEFASGNGYLFVFHPSCEPFYCIYDGTTVSSSLITVKIRDFVGANDGLEVNYRPNSASSPHLYNLANQGWVAGSAWSASTTAVTATIGSNAFTVQAGLVGVSGGQVVSGLSTNGSTFAGTVTSYAGTTLTINVTSVVASPGPPSPAGTYTITPTNTGYISTWNTAAGNYPSNADVWWYFKNASGVFDPATRIDNVTLSIGHAPAGHFVLPAFNQSRATISGLAASPTSTLVRPTNGAWFQGRVWYTGVNAQIVAGSDRLAYSWTENIYFSQVVQTVGDFGNCFQTNDPTSEELFDILPTDGGVIRIQDAGSIYKLFPIQNGMLVFAANGIWFITGSQGIGFAANDYTITKISSVRNISGTSFVDVNGLPYFWNEEGIYAVTPSKNGGLSVDPITVSTILDFYASIPKGSKKYVRGAYHPVDYIIQWVYSDRQPNLVTSRHKYNRILNYNTYNKAFFPYSTSDTNPYIAGIVYVPGSGNVDTPPPVFKYFTVISTTAFSYSDEHVTNYADWASVATEDYVSYFVTGYKLRGQAIKRFQPVYIQVYSNVLDVATSYKIQGLWDYSSSRNSGRWSAVQLVTNALTRFGTVMNRRKIRGHGFAVQFKFTSVTGMPFSIVGWAVQDSVNAGV